MPKLGNSYNPKSEIAGNDIDNKFIFSLSFNKPKEDPIKEEKKVKEISEFLNKLDKSQDIIGLSGSLIAEYEKLTKANEDRGKKIEEYKQKITELQSSLQSNKDVEIIESINSKLADLKNKIGMLTELINKDTRIINTSLINAKKMVPSFINEIKSATNVKELYDKATLKYIAFQLELVVTLKDGFDSKKNLVNASLNKVNNAVKEINKLRKKQAAIDTLIDILNSKSPQVEAINSCINLIDGMDKISEGAEVNKHELLKKLKETSQKNLESLKNNETEYNTKKAEYDSNKRLYQEAKAKYEENETKLTEGFKKLNPEQKIELKEIRKIKDNLGQNFIEVRDKLFNTAQPTPSKKGEINPAPTVTTAPDPLEAQRLKEPETKVNQLNEELTRAKSDFKDKSEKYSVLESDLDENQKSITKLTTKVDLLKKLSEAYESLDNIQGNDLGAALGKSEVSKIINDIKVEITKISGTDIKEDQISNKEQVDSLLDTKKRELEQVKIQQEELLMQLGNAKQQENEAQDKVTTLKQQLEEATTTFINAQKELARKKAEAEKLAKADVTSGNPNPSASKSETPLKEVTPSPVANSVIENLKKADFVIEDSKIYTSDGGFTCKTQQGFDCKIEQNGSGNIKIATDSWKTDGAKKEAELTQFLKETGWTEIQLKADGNFCIPDENIANVIMALREDKSIERNITVMKEGKELTADQFLEQYKQQHKTASSEETVVGAKHPLKSPDPKLETAISKKISSFVLTSMDGLETLPICITMENIKNIQSDITTAIVAALSNDSDVDTPTIKIPDDIISQISTNLDGKPDATDVFDAIKSEAKFIEGINKAITDAKAEVSKSANVEAEDTHEASTRMGASL